MPDTTPKPQIKVTRVFDEDRPRPGMIYHPDTQDRLDFETLVESDTFKTLPYRTSQGTIVEVKVTFLKDFNGVTRGIRIFPTEITTNDIRNYRIDAAEAARQRGVFDQPDQAHYDIFIRIEGSVYTLVWLNLRDPLIQIDNTGGEMLSQDFVSRFRSVAEACAFDLAHFLGLDLGTTNTY